MWKKWKHLLFPDADVMEIASRHGTYEYLQRYTYACDWNRTTWQKTEKKKVIWTCWLQGIEKAPLLVQKCIASMQRYAPDGYEVVVIDANNLSEYIKLPEFITHKHKKGIIPHAHYSDIIRLMLLKEFGGIWIDSTILLTDRLPDYITDADLFLYHSDGRGRVEMINPLIASCPHHPLLSDILTLLLEYWQKENRLVSYVIMPLFCSLAIDKSSLNRQLWEQVPSVSSATIIYMLKQLSKPYNSTCYDIITSLSHIHKLTYKFKEFGIDITKKSTFYDVLINGQEINATTNTTL